jgi:hypothetical protein
MNMESQVPEQKQMDAQRTFQPGGFGVELGA